MSVFLAPVQFPTGKTFPIGDECVSRVVTADCLTTDKLTLWPQEDTVLVHNNNNKVMATKSNDVLVVISVTYSDSNFGEPKS